VLRPHHCASRRIVLRFHDPTDSLKRTLNQAWFKFLRIDEEEPRGVQVMNVTRSDLGEAVEQVMDARKINSIEVADAEAHPHVERVGSSNIALLVGDEGLEPPTPSV
jgi:hypothetical protein